MCVPTAAAAHISAPATPAPFQPKRQSGCEGCVRHRVIAPATAQRTLRAHLIASPSPQVAEANQALFQRTAKASVALKMSRYSVDDREGRFSGIKVV